MRIYRAEVVVNKQLLSHNFLQTRQDEYSYNGERN